MTLRPLVGIRIADFTWMYSGPYGTSMLASLGAEVIKVESLYGRADTRDGAPFADNVKGRNRSGLFSALNPGKKSITLNLDDSEHVEVAQRLMMVSDVVTENFSAGNMEKFGLGYERLRQAKQSIIMVSLSGFGQTGPAANSRGWFSTIQAISGMTSMNGYPGDWPKSPGGAWADFVAGNALCYAVGAALFHRNRTGAGQHVDLAMTEVLISTMGQPFMDYFLNWRISEPNGNRPRDAARVQGVYPCRGDDAWVAIAVDTDDKWDALCRMVGDPALCRPEYSTATGRAAHLDAIDAALSRWTRERGSWEVTALLHAAGVPGGTSSDAFDLVEHPQLRARGMIYEQEHPEVGPRTMMALPLAEDGTRPPLGPTPMTGQHNDEIIGDLLGCPATLLARINMARDQVMKG